MKHCDSYMFKRCKHKSENTSDSCKYRVSSFHTLVWGTEYETWLILADRESYKKNCSPPVLQKKKKRNHKVFFFLGNKLWLVGDHQRCQVGCVAVLNTNCSCSSLHRSEKTSSSNPELHWGRMALLTFLLFLSIGLHCNGKTLQDTAVIRQILEV